MAESDRPTDALFKQILDKCDDTGVKKGVQFIDLALDYLQRKTELLEQSRAGALITQKVKAQVAAAKENLMERNRRPIPDYSQPKATPAEPKLAQPKKKAEETPEIEELDPKTLQPKEESKEIEMDEESDSESGEMPLPGNGGKTDAYSWTQTLEEIDVRIPVPLNIKGRNLDVSVSKNKMKVAIKGQEPIVNGEFEAEVADHMWTLETEGKEKHIVINIEKRKGMSWWKRVIKGDVGIKTRKIQPENSKLEDLDGETRKTVEKMMFDQRQKQLGKPTSKELDQQGKLNKFMAMHPEMDFSQAKFGNQGSGMGNMFGNMS